MDAFTEHYLGLASVDLANLPLDQLKHKRVDAQQGKASFEYIAKAIELADDVARKSIDLLG